MEEHQILKTLVDLSHIGETQLSFMGASEMAERMDISYYTLKNHVQWFLSQPAFSHLQREEEAWYAVVPRLVDEARAIGLLEADEKADDVKIVYRGGLHFINIGAFAEIQENVGVLISEMLKRQEQ